MPLAIPLSYFLGADDRALQDFELTRLSHVANLNKELEAIADQRNQEQAAADVARWLLEHRLDILRAAGTWLADAGAAGDALLVPESAKDPPRDAVGDPLPPHREKQRRTRTAA